MSDDLELLGDPLEPAISAYRDAYVREAPAPSPELAALLGLDAVAPPAPVPTVEQARRRLAAGGAALVLAVGGLGFAGALPAAAQDLFDRVVTALTPLDRTATSHSPRPPVGEPGDGAGGSADGVARDRGARRDGDAAAHETAVATGTRTHRPDARDVSSDLTTQGGPATHDGGSVDADPPGPVRPPDQPGPGAGTGQDDSTDDSVDDSADDSADDPSDATDDVEESHDAGEPDGTDAPEETSTPTVGDQHEGAESDDSADSGETFERSGEGPSEG